MRWRLDAVLTLVINTQWMQIIVTGKELCLCQNETLCKPISSSQVQVEVFTYHLDKNDWAQYQWSKITTIVVTDEMEDELYCIAHSFNIRLVLKAEIEMVHLKDKRKRGFWMEFTVELVRAYNVDGINLNFMEKLKKGSQNYHEFTKIVIEVTSYFRNELPGCQISFNVPWTPNCKNEKCVDFLAISYALDLFFVESFNIRNDMREGCVATPSSSYHHVLTGLSDYIKLGVDSRKLVMGVPWYGYDYTCKRFFEDGTCELRKSFKKDPCSYPVARRIPYKEVVQRLLRSLTGRLWNDEHRVPYFFYLDGKTYHQVWYDDPESISMKSTFLKRLKLGGIGMMNLSDVDPSRTSRAKLHAEEMWNALCPP